MFKNKRVLITGVCGTIGREILKQICQYEPEQIIGIDNCETELFFLAERYRKESNIGFFYADIRDLDSLTQHMRGINIVLHTAALKHVIISERSPRDAIRTNIIGVQNVIDAALVNNVQRVCFTSSDKAVNPTNVMGTSKLMGERLMTAASAILPNEGPVFTSTRFGNVVGSNGSVFHVFKDQIARGGPLTITDPDMTRFIMSISQAAKLVIDSIEMAIGGEVFVTKMPVIRIMDLAKVMIRELAPLFGHDPDRIDIEEIGVKPGEKLYEELINEEEVRRSIELKNYFVIIPAFKSVYSHIDYDYSNIKISHVERPYNSAKEQPMSEEWLRRFLTECRLDKVH